MEVEQLARLLAAALVKKRNKSKRTRQPQTNPVQDGSRIGIFRVITVFTRGLEKACHIMTFGSMYVPQNIGTWTLFGCRKA